MYEIYFITNNITKKSYIGLTKRGFQKRFRVHLSEAKRGVYEMYLHRSIRKYGPEAFTVKLLEICDSHEQACSREIDLIRTLGTKEPRGYNEHAGGAGGCAEASPELRAKLSASMKGRVAHNKGKPMSAEQKAKISAAHKARRAS